MNARASSSSSTLAANSAASSFGGDGARGASSYAYAATTTPSSCYTSAHAQVASTGGAVVRLFELLWAEREHFRTLTPQLAAAVSARLDQIQAHDLGVNILDPELMKYPVGYQEVHTGPEMTVCIFFLPAGSVIPLHDHPGMNVFGRLLFGRMRVISYDSCDLQAGRRGLLGAAVPPSTSSTNTFAPPPHLPRWATLHSDEVLGPSPVNFGLGPVEGNLHELRAIENTAFLDIIMPPYDSEKGRECTYYASEQDDGAGRSFLVPTRPYGFSTEVLPYKGPRPFRAHRGYQ